MYGVQLICHIGLLANSTQGFFPYFHVQTADKMTSHYQSTRHSGVRRQHDVREARNIICGHMKRNDPVSRRFIQYLALETSQVVIVARDVKTGRVLVQPPRDELWLLREKSGLGRANKNEWKVIKKVGPELWNEMDQERKWSLEFRDYFDVLIWDLKPGNNFAELLNVVHVALAKAHRLKAPIDLYRPMKHILSSLREEPETLRIRDLFPEEVEAGGLSLWDGFESGERLNFIGKIKVEPAGREFVDSEAEPKIPDGIVYNEADRLEDEVLFPWEADGMEDQEFSPEAELDCGSDEDIYDYRPMLADQGQWLECFESEGPDPERFLNDTSPDEMEYDFDYESDDADYDSDYSPNVGILEKLAGSGFPLKKICHTSWTTLANYMRTRLPDSAVVAVKEFARWYFGGRFENMLNSPRLVDIDEMSAAVQLLGNHVDMRLARSDMPRLIDPGFDPKAPSAMNLWLQHLGNPTDQKLQTAYAWEVWMDKEKAFGESSKYFLFEQG